MNRVLACLAIMAPSLFGATSAKGDLIYNFSFGSNASGTFTTGSESTLDVGYFELTSLTVTSFTDNTLGSVAVNIFAEAGDFQPHAAYNPTTGAFINHAFGFTFNDLGDTGTTTGHNVGTINGQTVNTLTGSSFSLGSSQLFIVANGFYRADGPLTITAVPEPSTAVLATVGFCSVILCRRRRRYLRQGGARRAKQMHAQTPRLTRP